jgi:hypothetical protein
MTLQVEWLLQLCRKCGSEIKETTSVRGCTDPQVGGWRHCLTCSQGSCYHRPHSRSGGSVLAIFSSMVWSVEDYGTCGMESQGANSIKVGSKCVLRRPGLPERLLESTGSNIPHKV